jgi:hypothetical protein
VKGYQGEKMKAVGDVSDDGRVPAKVRALQQKNDIPTYFYIYEM